MAGLDFIYIKLINQLSQSKKLYSLELLRFIAAFCVFFGHYVHFYDYFEIPSAAGVFYALNPSHWGGLAVPLFFMMSGAIFARNYEVHIREKKISAKEFFVKRFARLYPLHLVTLISVTVLQFLLMGGRGQYFIYQFNDLKHFILHLLFASHWGLEKGNSFNSPVWSVSHEIVLYSIFFVACILSRCIKFIFILLIIVSLIVPILNLASSATLLKSMFAFFIGCLIFCIINLIFKFSKKIIPNLIMIVLLGIFTYLIGMYFERYGIPFGCVGPIILIIAIFTDFVFLSRLPPIFIKNLEFLGGVSYSSYLLHFPIQILLVLVSLYFFEIDFSEGYMLLVYVILILSVSTASYLFMEKPLQRMIIYKFGSGFEKD